MTYVIPWSRHSARIQRVDDGADGEEHIIRGFLADTALRAFVISCPCCGSIHDIKAGDRHSRVFDAAKQRFRCSRCRFAGPLYVVVDVGQRAGRRKQSGAAEEEGP